MYRPIQQGNRNNENNGQQDGNQNEAFPFLMGIQSRGKPPRSENFWDFMYLTCCPTFTIVSFIFFISILDILLYIVSLVNSKEIKGEFLAPDINSLKQLGALYPYALKNGQVWLLITAFLLHSHFLHIIFNVFGQFLFGMGVETIVGTIRLASLYCVSGIGGNIFSALISDNLSVGASTCIFGLLGAQLVLIIINWDALERYGPFRCEMVLLFFIYFYQLLLIILIILLNFLFGMSSGEDSHVNNFGHFGGFFTGFFFAFILFKPMQENQAATTWKHVSIALLILYFILCFGIFYIFRHPEPLFGENGHKLPKTEKVDASKDNSDKKFF